MAEERGLSPFTVVRPSALVPMPLFPKLFPRGATSHRPAFQGAIFGSFALIIFVSSPLLGVYMSRRAGRAHIVRSSSHRLACRVASCRPVVRSRRLGQRSMLLGGLVVCSVGTFAFGFVGQSHSHNSFVAACFILRLIEGAHERSRRPFCPLRT